MLKTKLGVLGGAGLGAGLMYVLDPDKGGRRRSLVRHKAMQALRTGGKKARKTSRVWSKQARGFLAEAGSKLRKGVADERVLTKVGLVASQVLSSVRAAKENRNHSEVQSRWWLRRNAIGAALGAISLSLLAQNLNQRRGHAQVS